MLHFLFDAGGPNSVPAFTNPRSAEGSALKATPCPKDSLNGSCPFLFHTHEVDSGQNNRKRFLVFDRSGDKTTLLHSYSGKTLVDQRRICQSPNPFIRYNLSPNPFIRYNLCNDEPQRSIHPDMVKEMEDEMHEDTEELNALLCSDSDNDSLVDDEETSTGHSPSTMTDENVRDLGDKNGEEVDSTANQRPTKRKKNMDGGYARLLHDTESGCGRTNKTRVDEMNSITLTKGRVQENLRRLRNVIPYDVSGKNTIVVIDEAIRYLKYLKEEAEALEMNDA